MKRYRIEVDFCCGAMCAKFFEIDGWREEKTYHEHASQEAYERWRDTPSDSLEEKIAEFYGLLEALKTLLKKLVEDGKLTQAQADAELEKWLRNNPNPDPEAQPINVTEEFKKVQRRVYVPKEG